MRRGSPALRFSHARAITTTASRGRAPDMTLIEDPRRSRGQRRQPGARPRARLADSPTPEAAPERRRPYRDWFGAARSARSRILILYVILLAFAAVLALLAFRHVLGIRLDDQVDESLQQEVLELDRLVTDGKDPETGRAVRVAQDALRRLLERNEPGQRGGDGRLHRRRVPTSDANGAVPARSAAGRAARRLGGTFPSERPGRGASVTGQYDTDAR